MHKLQKRDLNSKLGKLSAKEIELRNSWWLSAKLIEFGLQVAQANDDWGGIDFIEFKSKVVWMSNANIWEKDC